MTTIAGMGGSCSIPRRSTSMNCVESFDQPSGEKYRNRHTVRHSVEAEVPNDSISHLYPIEDNFVVTNDHHRTPKSLVDLCVDTICRNLPLLDGDIPPGLPEEIVNKIVKSLVDHAALNATTLKVLRNCELGKLSLAGCRGVRDEWLESLSKIPRPNNTTANLLGGTTNLKSTDHCFPAITNHISEPHIYIEGHSLLSNERKSNVDDVEMKTTDHDESSRSTSSFISAHSKEQFSQNNNTNCNKSDSSLKSGHPATAQEADNTAHETKDEEEKYNTSILYDDYNNISFASTLTELDLCGSQQLTDRGLLQLHNLTSLEIAKLDNCYNITGRGLLAFSHSFRLHTLSMVNCRRLTDEALVNISHLSSSLESLVLEGCRCLTDCSVMAISNMLFLRKLDLSQCDLITSKSMAYLHRLEFIEELFLGWCRNIKNDGIKLLCHQPGRSSRLKILRLARCPITDTGVRYLSNLSSLEELDLNGCSYIHSETLGDVLSTLKNLEALDVSYCPGILRSSWQNKIDSLKCLYLNYSNVRDTHLSRLTNLPALQELNFDSCPVGDWSLAHLADNNVTPNLISLDLADSDLTDAGMSHLPKFKHLKKLSLFYCNISNSGLAHIARMTQLEELNLDSRDIGDEGLVHLRNLKNLKSLDIFSGRVTDAGCMHISYITSLTSLELCGGGVGDFGCAHLASRLDNLTSLNLSQNERITNRGAAALAALRGLKALNLSNTRVTSGCLKFLGELVKLQSLALYGCQGIDDGKNNTNLAISSLQNELPSLKCLRLNKQLQQAQQQRFDEDIERSYNEDEDISLSDIGSDDDEEGHFDHAAAVSIRLLDPVVLHRLNQNMNRNINNDDRDDEVLADAINLDQAMEDEESDSDESEDEIEGDDDNDSFMTNNSEDEEEEERMSDDDDSESESS